MIKKKNKQNKPDIIITSDWHLREDRPICRTDDFWKAQWKKVDQIFNLSYEFGCPIFNAGDVFNNWKVSPYLLNECIKHFFSNSMFSIIGNHEMPQHNIDNMQKSGLQTLFDTGIVLRMTGQMDWGSPLDYTPYNIKGRKIVISHIMTYKNQKPWPDCTDPECHELFDWFKDCDLIITGHNHKTFTAKKGKQLLVNPGSLTRQKADQISHRPCIFLYYSKTHKLKKHYLDIEDDVISREHIDIKKAKDKRISAFIKKLKTGWDVSLSFEDNLERAFKENGTANKIKQIIYEWIEK